jgi:hypothetical protein
MKNFGGKKKRTFLDRSTGCLSFLYKIKADRKIT